MKNTSPRRKHVLVTGGAGFIGSHLVEKLLSQGEKVVVIDDCSTGRLSNLAAVRRHPRLRVLVGKVSQCRELRPLVRQSAAIFHLAAAVGVELVIRSPVRTIQTNLAETQAVLAAAAPYAVPFLLASTSEVYGRNQLGAYGEEDDLIIGPPTVARWSYACSKLMDEFLTLGHGQEFGLPVIVARIFNTVGPRQTGAYGMVLPRFIEAARRGEPVRVYGDGKQSRCFCYVDQTVEALLSLLPHASPVGLVVNVGSNEEIKIGDLAKRVIKTLRSTSKIKRVPYAQAYAVGFEDMTRRKPALDKLQRLTQIAPRMPIEEIIQRIVGEA